MKKMYIIGLLLGVCFLCVYCNRGDPYFPSDGNHDVRLTARQSSVQTVFHIPVIHVSYTAPLPEPEKFTKEKAIELLEAQEAALKEQIENALEKFKNEYNEDRWESSLTDLEKWNYDPQRRTFIPLGAFAPKDVKFPENILVACKVKDKEKEISPWEKEYEPDILTISETANVSPSKAKEILGNIKARGYTITKHEVEESDEVEILYFSSWDTAYPSHLDWKVEVLAGGKNLIVGYDPRGVLEIKPPVYKDTMLHIKAGYFALKDKFKAEPTEITNLKSELETVRKNLKVANDTIEELKAKDLPKPKKRDITQATMWDLRAGTIKLEEFYFMSAASGIFLGNMPIRNEISTWGPLRGWGYYMSSTQQKAVSVILTNAHVAAQAMSMEMMVSEDKEHMWVLFPGAPSIRYTKHSDYFGTPAWIMGVDETPVISHGCDAGIMLSTAVPEYEKYKVTLGNSDKVLPGDPIVTVGNPAGLQKYTYQGIVSNTDYSMLDALEGSHFFKYIHNKPVYSWLLNTNFWIDVPGTGGVSGSGVWAMEGSENGKVVAIRNAGMMQPYSKVSSVDKIEVAGLDFNNLPDTFSGLTSRHTRYLFKDLKPQSTYNETFDEFTTTHPELKALMEQHHGAFPIPGLQIGIPINKIKIFLQERGLDPEHFGWDKLKDSYWVQ